MQLDIHAVRSTDALELYITAVPASGKSVAEQAREVFEEVKRVLKDTGARLLQERVFASSDVMSEIAPIRAEVYGDLDDSVPPSWLVAPATDSGKVAGVQVHAIKSEQTMSVVELHGLPVGRILSGKTCQYLAVSGLVPTQNGTVEAAAQSLLDDAEAILRQSGVEFQSLTRTWFWLGDILSWYDDFNRVRTKFFSDRGMIMTTANREDLPASTGIGVFPRNGAPCALDFVTVTGPCRLSKNLLAAGNQDSAFKYGSAFSRATQATTPAGETVYISGTAAIDLQGMTIHIGDAEAQIRCTLENVRGVLKDTGCTDADVVHTIAYCKTPEIEQLWQRIRPEVAWPVVTVIADVCRDDLLFELEATAVRGAEKLA